MRLLESPYAISGYNMVKCTVTAFSQNHKYIITHEMYVIFRKIWVLVGRFKDKYAYIHTI